MAFQNFGKRGVTQRTTQLGAGYANAADEGGGIVPGAHPEYQELSPGLKMPSLDFGFGKVSDATAAARGRSAYFSQGRMTQARKGAILRKLDLGY